MAATAFDTVAWNTAEEVDAIRQIFDKGWRKNRCLKTMQDWHDWQEFQSSTATLTTRRKHTKTGINLTNKGSKGVLVRTFLRAYTHELWGIEKTLSYVKLAEWLTTMLGELKEHFPSDSEDYEVKKYDVTYAARSKNVPDEGCSPRTAEIEALVGKLKEQFPGLETEKFFAA